MSSGRGQGGRRQFGFYRSAQRVGRWAIGTSQDLDTGGGSVSEAVVRARRNLSISVSPFVGGVRHSSRSHLAPLVTPSYSELPVLGRRRSLPTTSEPELEAGSRADRCSKPEGSSRSFISTMIRVEAGGYSQPHFSNTERSLLLRCEGSRSSSVRAVQARPNGPQAQTFANPRV